MPVDVREHAVCLTVEPLKSVFLVSGTCDALSGIYPEAGEEIYSRILEPERKPEEDARTADALRAALGPFRAHLRQMTPAERRRFTVQVMDKMKKVSGKGSGAYASLSRGSGRDADSRELGKRIMESRNVNLRHGA